METRSKVSGGSELPRKAIGAAIWQSGHKQFSNLSACKVQGNQHGISREVQTNQLFVKNDNMTTVNV